MLPAAPANDAARAAWGRAIGWARGRASDLWLGAGALAFGAFSLSYPFGHDQGLYYYVGREWLLHGRMPYRDALEQKTPGIFLLNGVLAAIFGEQQWAVRATDLMCVIALGLAAAWAVTRPGSRPPPGQIGFSCFAASVFFYGFFLYWDTAQCELYFVTAAIGSFAVARHTQREVSGLSLAGLLGGTALLFKPTSVWFVLLAAIAVVARGPRRRVLRNLALYGLTAAVVPGAVIADFWLHGALPAMVDVLVGANGYYVAHDRGVSSARDVLARTRELFEWFNPFASLALGLVVLGGWRSALGRDGSWMRRLALPVAATIAAYVSVAMQMKFYRYHWGSFTAAFALFAAALFEPVTSRLGLAHAPARRTAAVLALGTLVLYLFAGQRTDIWVEGTWEAIELATGRLSREAFTSRFCIPGLAYAYHDSELSGTWLREHSAPDDDVLVRGFQPEVYEIARRRYHGRFFWTNFLTDPKRAYRHEEWLAEDRNAILASPPRFVVTRTDVHEGVDSIEWIRSLGLRYETRAVFDTLQVSELTSATPAAP